MVLFVSIGIIFGSYIEKKIVICLPDIEKKITSPPNVSAAIISPSNNFIFFVSVAIAKSSIYLK